MKFNDSLRGLAALGLLLSFWGCSEAPASKEEEEEEYFGPLMRPGQNCLSCHREGNDQNAPVWSAAGTVYASADAPIDEGLAGVTVVLTDADGQEIRLVTNDVGNFFTPEPLADPFSVELEFDGRTITMPTPPPAGSCNACHAQPPIADAPGRIYAPLE